MATAVNVDNLMKAAVAELTGWVRGEFLAGILVVCRGVTQLMFHGRVGENAQLINEVSRKLRFFTVKITVAFSIVFVILWVVLAILLLITRALLAVTGNGNMLQGLPASLAFTNVLCLLGVVVEQCVVVFLRYWAYQDQDRVFVASLRQDKLTSTAHHREQLKQLADALEILPVESSFKWFRGYVATVFRGWGLAVVLLALSFVPLVGQVVLPMALMLRQYRAIGLVPALTLSTVSLLPKLWLLPSGPALTAYGFQLVLAARATWKELLYPVVGRASKAQRHRLSGRHLARLSGFGAAAGALLSVPLLGPFFWFDLVAMAAEVFAGIALESGADFDLGPAVVAYQEEMARQEAERQAREAQREARLRRAETEGQLLPGLSGD